MACTLVVTSRPNSQVCTVFLWVGRAIWRPLFMVLRLANEPTWPKTPKLPDIIAQKQTYLLNKYLYLGFYSATYVVSKYVDECWSVALLATILFVFGLSLHLSLRICLSSMLCCCCDVREMKMVFVTYLYLYYILCSWPDIRRCCPHTILPD